MNVLKTRTVSQSGTDYDIRAWREGEWYLVRAFRGDEEAGPLYGVNYTDRQDYRTVIGMDPLDELMTLAASHLREG